MTAPKTEPFFWIAYETKNLDWAAALWLGRWPSAIAVLALTGLICLFCLLVMKNLRLKKELAETQSVPTELVNRFRLRDMFGKLRPSMSWRLSLHAVPRENMQDTMDTLFIPLFRNKHGWNVAHCSMRVTGPSTGKRDYESYLELTADEPGFLRAMLKEGDRGIITATYINGDTPISGLWKFEVKANPDPRFSKITPLVLDFEKAES